ncbi:MAG: helix-turn-helix transcriptional regulator [Candidatus Borkfalkiaceae bacterium]|nr:helix-turn-helix transcriptional regulator [Christensenellaceae bacterium]
MKKEQVYLKRFSERLKELIGDKSVSSVAKQIGIPQQTLSRYLLGQREIGLENLCKIADFFNEDLDYLTGRKEF